MGHNILVVHRYSDLFLSRGKNILLRFVFWEVIGYESIYSKNDHWYITFLLYRLQYNSRIKSATLTICLVKTLRSLFCSQVALDFLSHSELDMDKIESIASAIKLNILNCSGADKHKESEVKCLPCIQEKNKVILSASALVQIDHSEELGRHLVATADIEPGKFLVVFMLLKLFKNSFYSITFNPKGKISSFHVKYPY